MEASNNENMKRTFVIVLFAIAMLLAILAGIGTGDSLESSASLWGQPDTTQVQAER